MIPQVCVRVTFTLMPFNVRRSGYVFSSTIVYSPISGESGYYVMHLRNAHIFNGAGNKAYVRAVRKIA